jgi:hypothetical protein
VSLPGITGMHGLVGASASSVSSGDPFLGNVLLLLGFNGTNGSTTITDESPHNTSPDANNGVTISTAQSQFDGASGSFTGGGTASWFHYTAQGTNYFSWVGTTDRTIEGWIRPSAGDCFVMSKRQASDNGEFILSINSSRQLVFNLDASGASVLTLTGTTAMTLNQWYYFAICRSGSTTKMFLGQSGGTASLEASGTQSAPPTNGGTSQSYLTIGISLWWGASKMYGGYMDELRLTEAARYTAAFPVPSAKFPRS